MYPLADCSFSTDANFLPESDSKTFILTPVITKKIICDFSPECRIDICVNIQQQSLFVGVGKNTRL